MMAATKPRSLGGIPLKHIGLLALTMAVVTALFFGAPAAVALLGLNKKSPFVTATAEQGSVRETVTLSGSVTRVNQAKATFPVSGAVSWLGVEVGEPVKKGQKLARLDTLPLKAAFVQAQAQLTQAQAAYSIDLKAASEQNKNSSTSSSNSSSTGSTSSRTTGSSKSSGSSTKNSGSSGSSGSGGSTAGTKLEKSMKSMAESLVAANTLCAPVIGQMPNPGPGATTGTSAPASTSDSTPASPPTSGPTSPTASASSTAASTSDSTPTDAETTSTTPSVTDSPTNTSPGTEPDKQQIAACLVALNKTAAAEAVVAQDLSALAQELGAAAQAMQKAMEAQMAAMAKQMQKAMEAQMQAMVDAQIKAMAEMQAQMLAQANGGRATGSMKAQLARDIAAITEAQVQVNQAKDNLDSATMKAPIKGVVGSIDFVQHGPATAYSGITIVGTGASEITVQVPLALMTKVKVGQVADVIPPGSTQTVPGEVKAISPLPSKLSTGTSYDAVISVPKSPVALTSGTTATAMVVVGERTDVLTVPVSAVAPTDAEHGTVQVVRAGKAEPVTVTMGAKGGSKVEIVEGLAAGQEVVIGDPDAKLPSVNIFGSGSGAANEVSPAPSSSASESQPSSSPTR